MEPLIRQQIDSASELLATLEKEAEALRQRDAEALATLAADKVRLTEQLEALGRRQIAALEKAGIEPGEKQMLHYAQRLAPERARALQKALDELATLLGRCKRQNLVNGQMIAAGRQAVQAALSLLKGQTAPATEVTYGPGGETIARSEGGPLAKA